MDQEPKAPESTNTPEERGVRLQGELGERTLRAMVADPEWSLERLGAVLEVVADTLETLGTDSLTISATPEEGVTLTDVRLVDAVKAVARVLRARQGRESR